MEDNRPWDTKRALRTVMSEYYSEAHESRANVDARNYVEGRKVNASKYIDKNEKYPSELWWMEKDAFEGWK